MHNLNASLSNIISNQLFPRYILTSSTYLSYYISFVIKYSLVLFIYIDCIFLLYAIVIFPYFLFSYMDRKGSFSFKILDYRVATKLICFCMSLKIDNYIIFSIQAIETNVMKNRNFVYTKFQNFGYFRFQP